MPSLQNPAKGRGSPHITVSRVAPRLTMKTGVIPGYTGYMQHMRQGTASLMGTYENCRKRASEYGKPMPGASFDPLRSRSISPNAMYKGADPRFKTNSKNKSSISWGDDRDVQFTSMYAMQYQPHGKIIQKNTEHDISEMSCDDRRKLYATALRRVGQDAASAVEFAMKSKLAQRTAGGPGSLRSAFKYFDRDGSGTIDLHEFFKVLEFIGFTFSEDQVIALFGQYDEKDAAGELDYNAFVLRVLSGDGVAAPIYTSSAVADRFRRFGKAPSIKIGQDQFQVAKMDVKRIFDKYDYDKSGAIDKKEMSAMVLACGLKLTQDDVASAMKALDKDKSGVVEFGEFWNWFQRSDKGTATLMHKYL